MILRLGPLSVLGRRAQRHYKAKLQVGHRSMSMSTPSGETSMHGVREVAGLPESRASPVMIVYT